MNEIINYINNTEILGFSMDIFAHFFVGMFITILGLFLKIPFGTVLFFLFGLESVKELGDYLDYNSPIHETIKDFFFTFLYPAILTPVRIYINKIND